jgi:hypothetical protein
LLSPELTAEERALRLEAGTVADLLEDGVVEVGNRTLLEVGGLGP